MCALARPPCYGLDRASVLVHGASCSSWSSCILLFVINICGESPCARAFCFDRLLMHFGTLRATFFMFSCFHNSHLWGRPKSRILCIYIGRLRQLYKFNYVIVYNIYMYIKIEYDRYNTINKQQQAPPPTAVGHPELTGLPRPVSGCRRCY